MVGKGNSRDAKQAIAEVSAQEIDQEMAKAAERYHVIGAWVAIIFDPIFGITDYINIPDSWMQVFLIRLGIAAVTLVALLLFKRGKISVYALVAIPLYLISLQNAYTYSLIDASNLVGHNLNYLALFMGAGLFILWSYKISLAAIVSSVVATVFFVSINPRLDLTGFLVNGGLLLGTGTVFTTLLIQARYALRRQEIKARLALGKSLEITARQKADIEQQNTKLEQQTQELKEAKQSIEGMNKRLQGYNEALEDKVQQRTGELKKANLEMDKLVYSLSHDFRTPMTNVRGLIQLSQAEQDIEAVHGLLKMMNTSLNRIDELQHDMMNYAVYWNEEVKIEKLDLKGLFNDLWSEFGYLHQNNLSLRLNGDNWKDWIIMSDREKMRSLLYTILSNAIRYQREEQGSIQVSVKMQDGILVEIADNGTGIKQEELPKVFDMFYRADPRSMGAGMGLYIARGIAAQLGGSIVLSSKPGEGTVVSLRLPGN